MVIVLFDKALCRSAFFYGFFWKTSSSSLCAFFESLNQDIKICVIMLCNFDMWLFSPYIKTHLFINNKLFKNVVHIVLCKNMLSEMF